MHQTVRITATNLALGVILDQGSSRCTSKHQVQKGVEGHELVNGDASNLSDGLDLFGLLRVEDLTEGEPRSELGKARHAPREGRLNHLVKERAHFSYLGSKILGELNVALFSRLAHVDLVDWDTIRLECEHGLESSVILMKCASKGVERPGRLEDTVLHVGARLEHHLGWSRHCGERLGWIMRFAERVRLYREAGDEERKWGLTVMTMN